MALIVRLHVRVLSSKTTPGVGAVKKLLGRSDPSGTTQVFATACVERDVNFFLGFLGARIQRAVHAIRRESACRPPTGGRRHL